MAYFTSVPKCKSVAFKKSVVQEGLVEVGNLTLDL